MAAERARGPYRTGVARRRQILDAAFDAFSTHGYHGTSLREISALVGITAPAILRHFGSKDELLQAVILHSQERAVATGDFHFAGLAGIRQLRSLMRFHVAHPGMLQLFITLTAEATSEAHPAHEFAVDRYAGLVELVELVADALRDAITRGEITQAADEAVIQARMLIALLDGLELQWLLDRDMDLVAAGEAALEMLLLRWGARPESAPSAMEQAT